MNVKEILELGREFERMTQRIKELEKDIKIFENEFEYLKNNSISKEEFVEFFEMYHFDDEDEESVYIKSDKKAEIIKIIKEFKGDNNE